MTSLIGGAVLISVGLLLRESVFLGDFTLRSIVFDALGVFFVVYGLVALYRPKARQ
jgi:hypothetical protein